ncbi:MAG: flagellar motor switch protein FliG, partial [SAR324 cluster bacterium]|nr:flagellar motor switch protein FliG [SAR324 cluster bacterium]
MMHRFSRLALIIAFIFSFSYSHVSAEYLIRSRPDPELKNQIHGILQKSLPEDYLDVSVIQHSLLSSEALQEDSNLVPGVKIATSQSESNLVFRYRTVILTVNQEIDLDQVEMRVRGEVDALEPQDRFEQSVLTEKLKIERQDFSQRLVEYLDLLVSAREDLREDRTDAAGEKLKNAAEISAAFPSGYEMIGIDQLIERDLLASDSGIETIEWLLMGLLMLLLLGMGGVFLLVSRTGKAEESGDHPLQGSLDKVASAIEGMAPEESDRPEDLGPADTIEDVTSETDDEEKVDYFGFIRRLPLNKQVALMQKIPPQYQAMVFTQMNSEDISQLIQQLPKLDALAAVLSLKEVEASPSQLEQLSEKLKDASAKLPVDFDGMDRIGEISGHLDSKVWDQILDSKDGLATRNPELAGKAENSLREIRARSISFDNLHHREDVNAEMISRVMERFERSRLSTGARVS